MGNICDCMKSSQSAEPAYTPIETVETSTVPKSRPIERSTSNYQTILEKASGTFISSKYKSRTEAIAINNNSEGAESVRSRFANAEVNPQIICSPPSTGIVLQSYSTFSSDTAAAAAGGSDAATSTRDSKKELRGVVSVLHAAPSSDPALEKSADELAQLMLKQTDRNIDKFSSNPGDLSAVVGFKPFEGSISSR